MIQDPIGAHYNKGVNMKTIHKYPLTMADIQTVEMPSGAEILTVQTQVATPCIWALVDTDNPVEEHSFAIFGTGHPIHEDIWVRHKYISTFQLSDGKFIFHLFERENK